MKMEKIWVWKEKATSIVTDVMAPESVPDFSSYFKEDCIDADDLNHQDRKMFALFIQYYA